jgi:hypothetical protein
MKVIFNILYALDRVAGLILKPVLLILLIELIMIVVNVQGFDINYSNLQ